MLLSRLDYNKSKTNLQLKSKKRLRDRIYISFAGRMVRLRFASLTMTESDKAGEVPHSSLVARVTGHGRRVTKWGDISFDFYAIKA